MAKQDDRRSRDAAGIGPYARERERLVPLSKLGGWDVVKGDADIRSWEVKTLSGKLLGRVQDLLVDQDAGEVVLLDVDLTGTDRRAYLPLRVAEVDRARRVVRADSGDLEPYDGDPDRHRLSAEELSTVRRQYRTTEREIPASGSVHERVIERRPIVEETVVRRRDVDDRETRL
jgi:hypothetical protein